jgi:hypothetical protein
MDVKSSADMALPSTGGSTTLSVAGVMPVAGRRWNQHGLTIYDALFSIDQYPPINRTTPNAVFQ